MQLKQLLHHRVIVTIDAPQKLLPLGLKVKERYLCDLARSEGLPARLLSAARPNQKSDAVALETYRVHILKLPEGPGAPSIDEACKHLIALFSLIRR